MLASRENEAPLRVLVCDVGRDRYALPLDAVLEVVPAVALSPLPGAPPLVDGVINVRGTLVPVLDLRARLGLRREPLKASEHFVLAKAGEQTVALRVDRASDLLEIPAESFRSAEALRGETGLVTGAACLSDGLVVVCDLVAFLDDAERRSLKAALDREATRGAEP